jgi:putative membrane protein (TIGR04086 family)
MIIISLLLGYNIGKISKDKGYLKGLTSGLILITILFLISLILHANIKLITLLYYLIIIICTTLSSMIGVNKK